MIDSIIFIGIYAFHFEPCPLLYTQIVLILIENFVTRMIYAFLSTEVHLGMTFKVFQ